MQTFFLIANLANYVLELSLFLAACLAVWRWGGPAVRLAGVINVVAWVVTTPANLAPLPEMLQAYLVCTLDLLTAAAFLYVAARYNNLWIAVTVLAEGVQTCIDLVYLGEGSSLGRIHHLLLGATDSAFTCAIQIAIIGAARADRSRLAPNPPLRV
jgi:hypothetical protein